MEFITTCMGIITATLIVLTIMVTLIALGMVTIICIELKHALQPKQMQIPLGFLNPKEVTSILSEAGDAPETEVEGVSKGQYL